MAVIKCMSRFLLVVTQVSDFHISNSQSNQVCRVISIYECGNLFRLRYLLKSLSLRHPVLSIEIGLTHLGYLADNSQEYLTPWGLWKMKVYVRSQRSTFSPAV